MKVVRLHAPYDMRVEEELIPEQHEGEELVRVKAVSLCGSDLHWFSEGGIGNAQIDGTPVVLGHEFSGEIVSGPRCGERVAIDPAINCGKCEFCQEGNPNFCTTMHFAGDGITTDGGLREFISWPARCLFRLSDSIDDAEGALLETFGVALHSIDLAHIKPGYKVGIFGCGPIGLLLIQLARLSGAVQIIATDPLPHRLEAACSYGATHTFLSRKGKENDEIWIASGKRGLDVTFEAAGDNDATVTAISSAKPGARVVLIGIPSDDKVAFCASTARRKGLTIKFVRRMKFTYPHAISLIENGSIDLRSLVTHTYPLTQAKEAFIEANKRSGLKVVIELSK